MDLYDAILTKEPLPGKAKPKRHSRRIYTDEDKLAGWLTDRCIYDLNGKVLGKAYKKRKIKNSRGETEQIVVYRGIKKSPDADDLARLYAEPYTEDVAVRIFAGEYAGDETEYAVPGRLAAGNEYRLTGNEVYCDGEYVGNVESKPQGRSLLIVPPIAAAAALALILALVLMVLLLIEVPNRTPPVIPVIYVRDDDGYWGEGEIAVLGKTVCPGKNGSYSFIVENPFEAELKYSFRIDAVYNGETLDGEQLAEFPLRFRLKMNNAYVETGDWLTAMQLYYSDLDFLANTKQSFTLEWEWPFENGQDDLDTRYGTEGGEMALTLSLTAEVK